MIRKAKCFLFFLLLVLSIVNPLLSSVINTFPEREESFKVGILRGDSPIIRPRALSRGSKSNSLSDETSVNPELKESFNPRFNLEESSDTHIWVQDPTNQTDGYYIEIGSGYQELNSSRGQTYRHYFNETEGSYRFESDQLVNKTGVIDDTDWVTEDEYPSQFLLRLTNGSIRIFDTPTGISNYISLIDNSTIWAVGYESFEGVMGFYLNFQDFNWGHGQYLFWPRLKNGQITSYNQPLYALYPHLFAKFNDVWFDQILNDRTLYTQPYQNPRNTLRFFNTSDTFGLYFSTHDVSILSSTWNFVHGFKFNFTDQQYHLITRFECQDRDFTDIGMGYEITSSPQSDGTPYQPDRFRLTNETHQVEVNVSQAWQAGTYLQDYYSRIDIVSQNNESFRFIFDDMETIGFTQKYLELHDQQMHDGSVRKALLVGMYGYGALLQDTWLNIDPATGTLNLEDNFDLFSYSNRGTFTSNYDYLKNGRYYSAIGPVQYTYESYMMWDTGIEVEIISTYTYSVVSVVNVMYETLEAGEGVKCRVYDIDGTGDGYSSHNVREDSKSYTAGTNSLSTGMVLDNPGTGSKTMSGTYMEQVTDYWAQYRGNGENYIKFTYEQYGCDTGTDDYIFWEDYEDSGSSPATLSFSYYSNTAPTAGYNTGMQNTYAGKSFATIKTDHADADGVADVDNCHVYLGVTGVWYGATWNVDTNTAGETGSYTGWGSIQGVSESGITNGFRLTWTLTLDWDFNYDDADYDVYARTYDESAVSGSSGWIEAGTTTHESDLEVVALTVAIDGAYEYGGTNAEIDDGDWFQGGREVTASGTVEYEGSSQTFDSSYATGVDVELLYGGADTNQIDTTISSGTFSGITYTPTSGSNDLDITTGAYFDVKINDVPSSGSDVTAVAIQKTSKRDNQVPTMASITVTGDGTVAGYEDWDQDGQSVSVNFSTVSDGSGSGFASYRVEVADSTPDLYSTTEDPYTYPDDVGTDGSYIIYARPRDNVWNQGTVRSDTIYVDETDPVLGTTVFTNEHYDAGTTCWYDQGEIAIATFQIPFTETNVYSIIVVCTLDGADRASDWVSGGSPFDSAISIDGRNDVGATAITIEIKDKSGRTDTTFSGDTHIALDNTAPTGVTGLIHSDSNTGTGYDPQNGYDDDLSAHYELQGTASDGSGSGLPTNCYRYEWYDGGFGSWVSLTTYDATVVDGQSADADAEITDNVGNVVSQDGEDITIDDDAPSGYGYGFTYATGYPNNYAYYSSGTIYFKNNHDSGDYFNTEVDTSGSCDNSGYWKVVWDVNGAFEIIEHDTDPLPESKNFNYWGDTGGTNFVIRVVNKAGNYQEFSVSTDDDQTNPSLTDVMSAYSEGGDTGEMWGDISTNTFLFSNSFDTDGTATFTATATDTGGAGLWGIDFGVFGADNPAGDSTSPYTGQYTINDDDTTGSITVNAYDHVGNSASGSITCTEDATGPSVSVTWNFNGNDWAVKSGTDYGYTNIDYTSVQDTGAGLDRVNLNMDDDGTWKTSITIASGLNGDKSEKSYLDKYRYYTDTGETGGSYLDDEYTIDTDRLYAFALDMVGNQGGQLIYTRLDRTSPSGHTIAMESGVFYASITNDQTPLVTCSGASDAGSGLAASPYDFCWRRDVGGWTYSGYQVGNTWEPTIDSSSTDVDFAVRIKDAVGNTDVYAYDNDNTVDFVDPSFTNIGGSESSNYLYAPSATTDNGYYSDNMEATLTDFNVIGDVTDNFGLEKADGTTHFSDIPSDSSITSTSDAFSLTYTINNGDQGSGTEVVTVTLYDQAGNYATDTFTFYEDNTPPTITTTGETESSLYLYKEYGTVKQGYYGSTMTSGQGYTISGTGSDGGSGMSSTVVDDSSFGGDPSNGGSGTSWAFAYSVTSGDNGDVTITYTGYDNCYNSNTDTYTFYEDNTAPTGYSLDLVADAADGGYTPVFGYYDDNSVDVDATDTGSITEGESGLSPTPYSFKTDLVGWSSYQSGDTYEYTGVSDGSRTCYVKVRDNVYNEGSDQTVGVVVDIDDPSGYTLTFARHTGWSNGYHMYLSGSIIYFGSVFNDYFTVTGNDDGDPNNSGYQRIKFDTSSVFETAYSDYDPLPQSKNLYYQSDSSGTFYVDIINNAGNYQRFTYTAMEDTQKPNLYVLSLDSYYHSIGEDVTVTGSTTDASSGMSSSNTYEWWVNPTRDYGTSWTSAGQKTWSGITDVYPVFYAAARDNVGNWRNASAIMGSFFDIVFIIDPQPEIEEIEVTEYYNPEDVYYDDLPSLAILENNEEKEEEIAFLSEDKSPEEITIELVEDNQKSRTKEANDPKISDKTKKDWIFTPPILLFGPVLIMSKRRRKW